MAAVEAATAHCLAHEAARPLAGAIDKSAPLAARDQRARQRLLLGAAIEHASRAVAAAEHERELLGKGADIALCEQADAALASARWTLAQALVAQAEDALHGAAQLSLSAQRAPTREACDEGWQRVAARCATAESAARRVVMLTAELQAAVLRPSVASAVRTAARTAARVAQAASKLLEERNHAYTFHTDGGFSFGEGWYLAAAAVLAGVTIQIEPGKNGTTGAETFLHDAGLSGHLQPYRSRPRAMKHTTELVGRAFRAGPASAQERLRSAFLGGVAVSPAVSDWIEHRLRDVPPATRSARKVLLWIRDGVHHPGRNTNFVELVELTARVQRAGLVPIFVGDALRDGEPVPEGAIDMILFWKDAVFRQADMRRAQLQFFEYLRERHGLCGQLGVTTAGMDGPALLGLPTVYLTDAPNVRMREWVGAVPGYEEVVRDSGYLDRVSGVLCSWVRRAPAPRIA
jgi:hypothetical protein